MALLVMDGLGDIATKDTDYKTPLEAANTPNLDALSKDSAMGRLYRQHTGLHQEVVQDILAYLDMTRLK